jgi:hypothetical protein
MTLAERLGAIRQGADKRIPPDKRAIMHRATHDLRTSGILDGVIEVAIRCRLSRCRTRLDKRSARPTFWLVDRWSCRCSAVAGDRIVLQSCMLCSKWRVPSRNLTRQSWRSRHNWRKPAGL